MKNKKIAFIGCGNMAQALIGGLIEDGFAAENIFVSDINREVLDYIHSEKGVQVFDDNQQAIKQADIVVLSVKPPQIRAVLQSLQLPQKALLLSIAAGIMLDDLQRWAGKGQAIVRCMPNTPALVQSGAAGLFANKHTSEAQKNLAESILRAVGITVWVTQEQQMNAVTALSGSGPAYYFLFMEAMIAAAVKLGLDEEQAKLLTVQTAFGSSKMALESPLKPDVLRQNVTSRNGTTEKALQTFDQAGLRETVFEAMQAACQRSAEIAKELGEKQ